MSEKASLRRRKVTESQLEICVECDSGKGNSIGKGPEAVYLANWKSSKKTKETLVPMKEGETFGG